ncbi:MAG: hypothetical protein G01um101438_1035 [Parcubacteria group bacterium Gr01-1014_38]|nr:MAG: hypothetical protein G01um101438_1035 [Parcubacteria group bacterium Gr01-1014_38]
MESDQYRSATPGETTCRDELKALFYCASLLLGNWPKNFIADCVFIPGLAVDNWQEDEDDDGILSTAAALYQQATNAPFRGGARTVVIPRYVGSMPQGRGGVPSPTGYPGGAVWTAELRRLDVPADAIVFYSCDDVGPDGKSWNTRTEADAFVGVARARDWTSAVVLATPFHLLRVLCTIVQALSDARYRLRLFPVTPRSVSWTKAVYHSQGVERLPRFEHIGRERERMPRYREQGSLCSFGHLATYLLKTLGDDALAPVR